MTMDLVQKHYTQHSDKSFQAGTILGPVEHMKASTIITVIVKYIC